MIMELPERVPNYIQSNILFVLMNINGICPPKP